MFFRKKPLVIEAEQFRVKHAPLPFRHAGVVQFGCACGDNGCCTCCGKFWIQTLEGPLVVSDGDWIIKGINGEYYPCKPDIFEKTYERVEQ